MPIDRDFLHCARSLNLAGGPDVKGAVLGKTPVYAPDRAVDAVHVSLDVRIDFAARGLSGVCETTVRSFRDGVDAVEFDAADLSISSVSAGGRPRRFSHKNGKLKVFLAPALREDEETRIAVRYKASKPKTGLHFVYPGPHNRKNPVQVWSQSQPEDARYWYPCHDSPHEKATSEMRITVPKGFRAVSNGVLIETVQKGAWTAYHWKMDHPHSIYLISLAAGKFSEVSDRWEDIPVTYYCERGREEDARRGFGKTPAIIDYFSKAIGVRYPYEKYAQVAVAEYPGGMEHTTCTTQTDMVLLDERAALDNDMDLLVAHELAHQWFGDLVTCRDWSHAWLNEGFATYFEILYTGKDKGADEADYELLLNAGAYFDEDARRYRRPIVCNSYRWPWVIFDRHTYEKGGWVLHMLRHELGDSLWWKAIRHYVNKHADGSVETGDLIEAIGEATGRNLKPFFDQWVYKSGYPQFRIQYDWDPKTRKAGLWVLQTQDVSEESPLFKVPVEFRFSGKDWTKDLTERVTGKEHRFSIKLPAEPLGVEFDPGQKLLAKASFPKPQAMWRRQLLFARAAVKRGEAAAHVAAWGDAESAALLEKAVRREKFWGAAGDMVRALASMRSEAAYAAVKRLLSIKDPKVRRAAVDALGQFQRADAAPALARLARKDPSINVEAQASRALGRLRDPRHHGLLRANLAKRSYRDIIAAGAIGGLAASRDPRVLETLRKACRAPFGFGVRVQALRSLSEYAPISHRVVPWICEIASDPDERINLTAISVLGSLEDERAMPALKRARKSPNSRIQAFAAEAIARIQAGAERRSGGKRKK